MSITKETKKKTVWFGMKLTPEQKEKIRTLARRRGVTQKRAVLDLVEQEVNEAPVEPKPGSILARTQHICGVLEGPVDLSSNPKHMQGYGQ